MSENANEITLNLGIVSIPENRLKKAARWVPKWLAGTHHIESSIKVIDSNFSNISKHISAMTEIVNILVADISGKWTPEKRERIQKMMWNFGVVNKGLSSVIAKGNPFTQQELDTLKQYTQQAQSGKIFTPEQATQFRNLSERASNEYPNQEWVGELLKIALFVFAVYAIAQLLRSD